MVNIIAKLIIEKSGGNLAVEIWENGKLVWSHSYLSYGASALEFERIKRQIVTDMLGCENWMAFENCDYDSSGNVLSQDTGDTSMVVITYHPPAMNFIEMKKGMDRPIVNADQGWEYVEVTPLSNQIVFANQDRLPKDMIDKAWFAEPVQDGADHFLKELYQTNQ